MYIILPVGDVVGTGSKGEKGEKGDIGAPVCHQLQCEVAKSYQTTQPMYLCMKSCTGCTESERSAE